MRLRGIGGVLGVVVALSLFGGVGVVGEARAQGGQGGLMPGPTTRFVPREVCVFPRNPADSRAIALEMRSHGLLILARAPISGMILAATPVAGTEWITCQWLKTWAGVRGAELNFCGLSFGPEPACPITPLTPLPCGAAHPELQLVIPCPTTPPPGHPNDPDFCFQWGLHNTGQLVVDRTNSNYASSSPPSNCWVQVGKPGVDVNLLAAWEFTTGSPLIAVAVLDSGVEKCNPDFDPNRFLAPDLSLTCVGADYVEPAYPCCPPPELSEEVACDWGPAGDNLGHGTICAGIIAATVGNGVGIAGMDQQCKLLAARVQGNSGTAGGAYGPVNAARYIVALERIAILPAYRSVRVISMSIGLPIAELPEETLETLIQAIDVLASQNRFIVAAAGNGGAEYPADGLIPQSHPSVICVGAIDSRGWRMAAPTTVAVNGILGNGTSGTGAALDFTAPGTAEVHLVCDSNPCPLCPSRPVNPYPTFACYYDTDDKNFSQGTSWAAPKVAAAISLLLAEAIDLGVVDPTPATSPETWPGLTFAQMYDILKAGARDQVSHYNDPGDPLDTTGRDDYYGWGLIDIGASMCALHALAGQPCP